MRSRIVLLTVAAVVILTPVASDAFDKNRSGFILGFGVGPTFSSFTQEMTSEFFSLPEFSNGERTLPRESKFGIGTDLKVGWGFNDQLLVYYTAKVAWFRYTDVLVADNPRTPMKESVWVVSGYDIAAGQTVIDTLNLEMEPAKDIWIASGMLAIGLSYYLSSDSPIYLTLGGGLSTWTAPLEDDVWLQPFNDHTQTWWGPSAYGGVGYEFMKHWTAEAIVMWGRPGETGGLGEYDFEIESSVISVLLSVNGLIY